MKKGAVIIGGTSGIGLETALYLKKCGYKVLIGGRSKSKDKIILYKNALKKELTQKNIKNK
jgi:NAD(P)-dependent dehydrogenase (short-subunit alcohol dehydrogenase family)